VRLFTKEHKKGFRSGTEREQTVLVMGMGGKDEGAPIRTITAQDGSPGM